MVQGGVDAGYFLDRMQWYEIAPTLKGIELAGRAGWEQARLISLTTANAMGCRVNRDAFLFSWEKGDENEGETPDRERIKRLKNKINKLNGTVTNG